MRFDMAVINLADGPDNSAMDAPFLWGNLPRPGRVGNLTGAGPTPYSTRHGRAGCASSAVFVQRGHASSGYRDNAGALSPHRRNRASLAFPMAMPGTSPARRVAPPSFIRFGNFGILRPGRNSSNNSRCSPLIGTSLTSSATVETIPVCSRRLRVHVETIAQWMRGICARCDEHRQHVDFGATIDYGPRMVEGFDPNRTSNTTDAQGRRYCFGAQPQVGQWNVQMLVHALYGPIDDRDTAIDILRTYADISTPPSSPHA